MSSEIKQGVEMLRKGGLMLFHADIGWGMGCDATNNTAVTNLFKLSNNNIETELGLIIDSPAKLPTYVDEIPDIAWDLIAISDTPLTLVYPKYKNLAERFMCSDFKIGIRIVNDKFTKMLCERFRKPLVFCLVDTKNSKKPTNIDCIEKTIKDQADFIVNITSTDGLFAKQHAIIQLGIGNTFKIIKN